ncbi:TetR/AcrR family transcriptional regulator [Vibrio sp. SM6]|uniref:TetR/AcrR family transcriptional regulator n=1 Tax=Vibrio agarilyticus TaxID=2726741 RepID=A0A7X8TS89_9VIBR|nr:TetR/AcrR family transcriptional regulator [Vibrio agarilyticus]NLS13863.1 TetR/AcrR family transcriptional regulator [Vibrio agarilyticus]
MARRNDHTREELTALTLATVNDFLDHHSYHELSLRKIAAMVGYVPSTLVNVFGNYNLLLLHVVAKTLDSLSAQVQAQICHASSPREALLQLAYCYHDFAMANRYRWQLVFEHNMNGETLPEWHATRIDSMTHLLETLLRQLTPDQDDNAIIEASRVLWAGVHGITLLSVDDKFFAEVPIDGKALIDNLLTKYLAA